MDDVEDEKKDIFLSYHSEKLEISFGLISILGIVHIGIINNIFICGDCHTISRLISKVAGREIIVMDVSWYHHFKDGMCFVGIFGDTKTRDNSMYVIPSYKEN